MNEHRLHAELQRLYDAGNLADAQGRRRVAALELSSPADWPAIAALWRGVQSDLGLPAPAIAVSGTAGFQLWFSFAQPQPAERLAAFLEGLRQRYLGALELARVTMQPGPGAARPDALALPPRQLAPERWSAFVAPDLGPVFAAEPWLDTEPGADGQADLLLRLASIEDAEFSEALDALQVDRPSELLPAGAAAPAERPAHSDPRSFLLEVMNDASVALSLRIEAAKALMRSPHP